MDALIGHSGFVGTTLQRQRRFDALFRSRDVDGVRGRGFDLVVCAGVSAKKWLANREPAADRAGIARLTDALDGLHCRRFVLVSTVDVFASPQGVDEDSRVEAAPGNHYGNHRHALEQWVRARFPQALIVRLPGLVGPGLRKNALFDLHNGRGVEALDPRAVFQFYPTVSLWADLQRALAHGLRLLHLTAAPLGLGDIAREAFGRELPAPAASAAPIAYDLRSRHAALFGGHDGYTCSARESLTAIRAYAQTEPRAR